MNPEVDFFSQFVPSKVDYLPQQQLLEENQKEEKKFNFDSYLPQTYPEETKLDSLLRQSTQYGSRILERIGGFPADFRNFLKNIVISSYENAQLGLNQSRQPEKQREAPEWLQSAFTTPFETFSGYDLPTSPELQQLSEETSKGYTQPRTYAEEKIGNLVGDITSSFFGGNKSIKNNLLIPIGANLFEMGIETAGFDKPAQVYGKNGAWFLMGLAANANANKYAGQLQDEARNSITPNTPTNIQKLGTELRPLNRKWLAGDARSASAQGQIKDIITDLRKGKNSVQDLVERIDAINAEIDLKGGFDYSMKVPPKVRKAEIRNLNDVKKSLYKTLEDSLQNQPDAFKKFMDAQGASAAIGQSNKFMNFALKHWKKSASIGLGSLLGGLYIDPVLTGIGSVALLGLHKAGQVAIRMSKSPHLRKYYLNAVKASVENDIPVFIQNMEALDAAMLKEEQKKKPPYKFQES